VAYFRSQLANLRPQFSDGLSHPDFSARMSDSPVCKPDFAFVRGKSHESSQQRPADLRKLQNRPPKGHRAGHLHDHQA
jgi:hypothetical protein